MSENARSEAESEAGSSIYKGRARGRLEGSLARAVPRVRYLTKVKPRPLRGVTRRRWIKEIASGGPTWSEGCDTAMPPRERNRDELFNVHEVPALVWCAAPCAYCGGCRATDAVGGIALGEIVLKTPPRK